jgi:hypothetical protein
MNKYIGFDIDCNKVVACVVESGRKDLYRTFSNDIESMKKFLKKQKTANSKFHLAFKIRREMVIAG